MKYIFSGMLPLLTIGSYAEQAAQSKLWYNQPAINWEPEALPIGNGRMGAMLYGAVKSERIQFNEQSLWGGDNNWDGAFETSDHGFGSYRNFGEFVIDFDHSDVVKSYQRSLNITTGIHTTSFEINSVKYTRQAFASYPNQVIVFRYTAGKKGAFSGKVSMVSEQGGSTVANASDLSCVGTMPNQLKYAAKLQLVNEGGAKHAAGNTLVFENCNTLIFYLDARTNYKPDYASGWRGTDPMPLMEKEMAAAKQTGYQSLLAQHVKGITSLTNAARIDIGKSDASALATPTDVRLRNYAAGAADPDLEETIFQYGRYLLVSSSRPGGLPANLQDLWNNSNTPAWVSDYHNNINVQMNYWGAESTNLSACHIPLIDYIVAQQEPCRIATRKGDRL